MSIVETSLVFIGIPAVVVLLVAVVVYARANERTPRYRPGGPWQFNPVWYLPHLEHTGQGSSQHAAGAGTRPAALEAAGARPALAGRAAEPVTASGGASGEW